MSGVPIRRVTVRREPSTPRKRHTVGLLTPEGTPEKKQKTDIKQLFPEDRELHFDVGATAADTTSEKLETKNIDTSTLLTPTKESPVSSKIATATKDDPSEDIFFLGKSLFQRGSKISKVVGRDAEKKKIASVINDNVANRTSAALYVSGLPGTGKSALVNELIGSKHLAKAHVASLNCMTIDKPEQTYSIIAKQFGYLKMSENKDKQEAIEILRKQLSRKDTSHVLVMDELDQIVTADQEVLFKLFEWSCGGSTNLVLIGIANAIDLTDRFLPRLQAHRLKPEVIAFKPYTTQGITEIIEARLKQLPKHLNKLMHPAAVRICAAKTAANSGDLRKAFDICRRSIEVIESEGKDMVTTQTVAKVCQSAFGGVNARERLQLLNFQQKAVLCVLMKQERTNPSANITVIQAFHEYAERCSKNSVFNSLAYPEYMEVVNALEAAGLVAVTGLCFKKGLGSHGSNRISRGGSGASSAKGADGCRDDFGLRKISSRAQLLDVVTDLADNDPLRDILM